MTTLRESPAEQAASSPARRRSLAPLRPHVLSAVFARDFLGYFSNPAGYVFITLFVLVCSLAEFWQPIFFANNLANLAPLSEWMPYILLFFIPAITMNTWAEERKQGTEELLLTLPARDVEVVLGKYLAALGIYTVALFFLALGPLPLLGNLGRPDIGVLVATYLGYWLMGAMLIAFGMVASILTGSATVAFILGALFGAVPVFGGLAASAAPRTARRLVEGLSVSSQVRDFGSGVVTLSGVVYFLSLTVAMLYLNMVLLGRRHWAGGEQSRSRWSHAAARFAAVIVALIGVDVIVQKTFGSWRADLTEERLHALSGTTKTILRAIPKDRPVFVDAYISPEVPREYVQTRLDLIDTLKEFAAVGGDRIRLNLVDAPRNSTAARDAAKRYGISPQPVRTIEGARQDSTEITMGVAFSSGLEEVVIPFFDRGLPVEYELARSVRTVAGAKRKRVGILTTDAKMVGGLDFQAMVPEGEWLIVRELKKQYDVATIAADAPIPQDLDALIVAQPSSLSRRQISHLERYVRNGGPTLLLVDPHCNLLRTQPDLDPRVPKRPAGGMFGGGQPPEPKGDLKPLMTMLGVVWPDDEIVWNNYNPHPKFKLPPENLFVGRNASPESFARDATAAGLQELILPYAGDLYPLAGASTKFTPLLRTDELGGTVPYDSLIRQSMFGPSINPDPPHVPGLQPYTIAARITGPIPADPASEPGPDGKPAEPAGPGRADVIVIADLDFITDPVFALRLKPVEAYDELDFDNVPFLLNCVDSLAGDDTFFPLRARRAKHRTLQAIEEQSRRYVQKADEEAKAAADVAKTQLDAAQKSLDKQVADIRANKEMDERAKETALRYREAVENRKLDVAKTEIEDKKQARVADALADRDQSIQSIQNGVRAWALLWPPLPPLLLGCLVFFLRLRNENLGATPARLA